LGFRVQGLGLGFIWFRIYRVNRVYKVYKVYRVKGKSLGFGVLGLDIAGGQG
jgi:hypothetical protein